MDERSLDDLLLQSRANISGDSEDAARALARDAVSRELAATPTVRRRRAVGRVLIPTGAAVFALCAAGTVAAYQLSIPPFQTTEPGVQRTTGSVPVDYRLVSGRSAFCDAFVETRGASRIQRERIESMIGSTDWSGYGQRTYDALPQSAQSVSTAPGPVGDVVLGELEDRARAAAPGVEVTGGAISCTYGTRVDDGQ